MASGRFPCQVGAFSSRGIVAMNRREVLLLLAGTAALPDRLLAIGRTVHKRVRVGTLRTLNPHQNETVATIAELIIPKTDPARPREPGGPACTDAMLGGCADDAPGRTFTERA